MCLYELLLHEYSPKYRMYASLFVLSGETKVHLNGE